MRDRAISGGDEQTWLEVEMEFNAAPEWTDELTLKYYILFNGRLLIGEITHTNISAGLNCSVMCLPPRARGFEPLRVS